MPTTSLYNEKELVSQLSTGSEWAFEQLYHHYSPGLASKLLRITKSEQYTGDILQEVFLKIWNGRENLEPDKSFPAYLNTIAEHLAIDYFRKAARDRQLMASIKNAAIAAYDSIEESLYRKENAELLHSLIKSLPPQRRQVFHLVKIEGRSYDEVGQLLNVSSSTISDHIVKATKQIRERLLRHPDYAIGLLTVYLCI
ncbi:RNA polymerase sigma factor [Flavihumibacter sp. UBA7668]|uniref:RNA polymerase sigma factor n=1 Tax=Flavihumibacter sp. UBA7668 TaxID=1946542 RepID=UPI0025B901F3|nr:RNA polymerase sigma-70 factor [Flavihumibacter sp. UBA7668]